MLQQCEVFPIFPGMIIMKNSKLRKLVRFIEAHGRCTHYDLRYNNVVSPDSEQSGLIATDSDLASLVEHKIISAVGELYQINQQHK